MVHRQSTDRCHAGLAAFVWLMPLFFATACGNVEGPPRSRNMPLLAMAVPDSIDHLAFRDALVSYGISGAISVDTLMVPLSDFSRVTMVPFKEVQRRLIPDDPRLTPLLGALATCFMIEGPGVSRQIWYIPGLTTDTFPLLGKFLSETGLDIALDLSMIAGSQSWFYPMICLIWLIVMLGSKSTAQLSYRILLVIPWLVFLPMSSVMAAALFILGTGCVAIFDMHCIPSRQHNNHILVEIRKNWPQWLFILLVAVTSSMQQLSYLLLTTVALLVSVGLIMAKSPITAWLNRSKVRQAPGFQPILMSGLNARAMRIAVAALICLLGMLPVRFLEQYSSSTAIRGLANQYHIQRLDKAIDEDPAVLIDWHVQFQETLTWGRLGDAQWTAAQGAPVFDHQAPPEGSGHANPIPAWSGRSAAYMSDKDYQALLLVLQLGGSMKLIMKDSAELYKNLDRSLDSTVLVFYIMTLVPFMAIILGRRRHIMHKPIVAQLDRQVA
jgi:hypothetical protein